MANVENIGGRNVVVERARRLFGRADRPMQKPIASAPIENKFNPSWSHLLKIGGNVELTSAQAAHLAKHYTHAVQQQVRPIDSPGALRHIDVLSALMETGAWLQNTQLRFGLLGGRLWTIDGNHRLHAQAKSGRKISWNIVIDECRDEAHLRMLFSKFNTNSRARSDAQILTANGFAEQHAVAKMTASAVYAAMPTITAGFSTAQNAYDAVKNRIFDRRLTAAEEYGKEAKVLDDCLKGCNNKLKKKLLGAGVAAVALVTLKHRQVIAKEFWSGVAKNDGLRRGDPRQTLVSDLLTRNLSGGPSHQASGAAAAAWNAWYQGRTLSKIRVLETDAVRIEGTPFKGSPK